MFGKKKSVVVATPAQQLAGLRELLSPEINDRYTDSDCFRFLASRNGDVPKARDMLMARDEWYYRPLPDHTLSPSQLLDDPDLLHNHIFAQYFPQSNLGEDKQGHPIYWEKSGIVASSFRELNKVLPMSELIAHHVRNSEILVRRGEAASRKYGRPIEKFSVVLDLTGLGYTIDQQCMALLKRATEIDDSFYNERLLHLYVINAGFFFSTIWAIVKTWLDPITRDKVQIVGSNYLSTLRQTIDDSQIPVELGGTREHFSWQWPTNCDICDELMASQKLGPTGGSFIAHSETVSSELSDGDGLTRSLSPLPQQDNGEPAVSSESIELVV